MPQDGNSLFWVVMMVALVGFLFLPQWMSRRRQRQREADLRAGDTVVTIGGFIGELTYIDFETNVARIRLAEGLEVNILPGAISGKRPLPMSSNGDDEPEVPDVPDSDA